MKRHAIRVGLAALLLVAACGDGESGSTEPPSTFDTRPGPSTVTSPEDQPETTVDLEELDEQAQATVDAAMDDLADRTDADEIELVSFEYVTWNDGSLGCPEPGEMYTQALVEGSRTILRTGGTEYAYHAGQDGDPFLCERPAVDSVDPPSDGAER